MNAVSDSDRTRRAHVADIGFLRREGRDTSQTMVLLHGIGSNAQSFGPLMSALTPTFDVIAWDAPGYADSRPLANLSPAPQDYAEALKALLDALGVTTAAIVGHSLGCLFAASFAATYPGRVSSVAMLSPALGYRVPAGAALPPAVQGRIDEIEALGPPAFAQKRAARLLGDPNRTPQVLEAVRRAMAAVNVGGYVQAVRALGAGDLLADVARIRAPALVAVGSKDIVTPPSSARAAHGALKNAARYQEIDGAGHALPQEEPILTASLLAQLARSGS